MSAETDSEVMVQADGLVAHYGAARILDEVSLRVQPGEIHVIMGASGSGKSTLLRHLLGLRKPSAGIVRVLGQDLVTLRKRRLFELRRKVGVAFQRGALLSSLSVLENVELPLRQNTKLDANTIRIMARMKLELMNLSAAEHLMPSQLSGGMSKRAGLARAVAMDPTLLFFDEPSAGLDPIMSAELDELILKLRHALRMTIVVVTHELESAFTIADRMTIIDAGRVLTHGTPDEIRTSENPKVVNMLERRSRAGDVDSESYLHRLTR